MQFGFIEDLFHDLTHFVAGLEPWAQVGALFLIGAIPFIEALLGSWLGVVLGVNPFLAVSAAVIGNIVCTFVLIALAGRVRTAATGNREDEAAEQPSKRRQKVAKAMGRFGVPGVCLLGPFVLASQIVGPALVALGANRRSVYLWVGISIIIWGVVGGLVGQATLSVADYYGN